MVKRKVDAENRAFQIRWETESMFTDIDDETTDKTDTAQLAIFICGVDSNLFVMEEILDIKSMHETTTGKDLFEKYVRV
uniref:Uncharacterized protein n=1 Tax=Octopus bimaculoides TaxID=37653 RepID=A0A0L8GQ03_OCTBM